MKVQKLLDKAAKTPGFGVHLCFTIAPNLEFFREHET